MRLVCVCQGWEEQISVSCLFLAGTSPEVWRQDQIKVLLFWWPVWFSFSLYGFMNTVLTCCSRTAGSHTNPVFWPPLTPAQPVVVVVSPSCWSADALVASLSSCEALIPPSKTKNIKLKYLDIGQYSGWNLFTHIFLCKHVLHFFFSGLAEGVSF